MTSPKPIGQFINEAPPAREFVLTGFLGQGELCMLFAPTGLGKSYAAIIMGICIANGIKWLDFECPSSKKVLYVDGEMGEDDTWDRFYHIAQGSDYNIDPNSFMVINPSDFKEENYRVPNISTAVGQKYYEDLIRLYGFQVIFFDNFDTVCRAKDGHDTEFGRWERTEGWLIKLRSQGITIVIIHHTNKGGEQARGSQKKDDLMSSIVSLRNSRFDPVPDCLTYELHFTKGRRGSKVKALYVEQSHEDGISVIYEPLEMKIERAVVDGVRKHNEKYCQHRYKISPWEIQGILERAGQIKVAQIQEDNMELDLSKLM